MNLLSLAIRHERRIRLTWSAQVGGGGFSQAPYAVASTDGQGASPSVQAAMVVVNSPNTVELQLSTDLVSGSRYQLTATNVPDVSSVLGSGTLPFTFGASTTPVAIAYQVTQLDATLYGIDLLFSKGDFVEAPSGDLQTVSGAKNVREALWRRLLSEGLPWDQTYGVKTRQWVDGTPGAMPVLKGKARQQMLQDDRVKACSVSLTTSGTQAFLVITPTLIGAGQVDPLQVPVVG